MTASVTPEYLTPPQVAKLLAVKHDKILSWIRTGELRAINLAARQGGRPRWRISRHFMDFWACRGCVLP